MPFAKGENVTKKQEVFAWQRLCMAHSFARGSQQRHGCPGKQAFQKATEETIE